MTGAIRSPNYPDLYPNDADCGYVIDVSNGVGFTIEFVAYELESRYGIFILFIAKYVFFS